MPLSVVFVWLVGHLSFFFVPTPAQYMPVYKDLSQMHQRFRVGSSRATKQSSI